MLETESNLGVEDVPDLNSPLYGFDGSNVATAAAPYNFHRRVTPDEDAAGIRFCGQLQRVTWWDQSCAAVSGLMPTDPALPLDPLFPASWTDGVYDSSTGFQAHDYVLPVLGPRCQLREARALWTDLRCGHDEECGASGLCVPRATIGVPCLRFLDLAPTSAEICITTLQGGPYNRLCVDTGKEERHHMPSAEAIELSGIKLTYGRAPTVVLTIDEHRLTASWGKSDDAAEYRAEQVALIKADASRKRSSETSTIFVELLGASTMPVSHNYRPIRAPLPQFS